MAKLKIIRIFPTVNQTLRLFSSTFAVLLSAGAIMWLFGTLTGGKKLLSL